MRKLLAVLRSAVIAPLFVSIWTFFLPQWFAGAGRLKPAAPLMWLAVVPGLLVMAACVWQFAWRGLGTPAPFDPPRRLVVSGPYRFVRNPMYVGMVLTLAGETLLFPGIRGALLIEAAVFWLIVTLFVVTFEEPVLRGKFGADYERYRDAVGRWIPLARPWYPPPHLE